MDVSQGTVRLRPRVIVRATQRRQKETSKRREQMGTRNGQLSPWFGSRYLSHVPPNTLTPEVKQLNSVLRVFVGLTRYRYFSFFVNPSEGTATRTDEITPPGISWLRDRLLRSRSRANARTFVRSRRSLRHNQLCRIKRVTPLFSKPNHAAVRLVPDEPGTWKHGKPLPSQVGMPRFGMNVFSTTRHAHGRNNRPTEVAHEPHRLDGAPQLSDGVEDLELFEAGAQVVLRQAGSRG